QNMPLKSDGFRGVILLKSGLYEVSNTIKITKSGVVLRGEGQGQNGTILKATRAAQHTLIEVSGTSVTNTRTLKKITTNYVGTGNRELSVESLAGIAVGYMIAIYKTPNQQWINDLDMAQYGWTASGYNTDFERKVIEI